MTNATFWFLLGAILGWIAMWRYDREQARQLGAVHTDWNSAISRRRRRTTLPTRLLCIAAIACSLLGLLALK